MTPPLPFSLFLILPALGTVFLFPCLITSPHPPPPPPQSACSLFSLFTLFLCLCVSTQPGADWMWGDSITNTGYKYTLVVQYREQPNHGMHPQKRCVYTHTHTLLLSCENLVKCHCRPCSWFDDAAFFTFLPAFEFPQKNENSVIIFSPPCWWKVRWSLLVHKTFLKLHWGYELKAGV